MTHTKKNKRVLVKVKDLDEEKLDAAIDAALDSLFGKDEDEKPVRVGKVVEKGNNTPPKQDK